jgi:uracil-DNA glycosylase family 4
MANNNNENDSFNKLSSDISSCCECKRLRNWCDEISIQKKPQFKDLNYWSKPVSGFGDQYARVLIIGLAPGAHGANRTGRPFTGDKAGEWLYQSLCDFGFSNKNKSISCGDDLQLRDVYISNIVKCAPPKNEPNSYEIKKCSQFLEREFSLLKNIKIVLVLGGIAFKQYLLWLKNNGADTRGITFEHGKKYKFENSPTLLVSYHPSAQNTNTGRLRRAEWEEIFKMIINELKEVGEPMDKQTRIVSLDDLEKFFYREKSMCLRCERVRAHYKEIVRATFLRWNEEPFKSFGVIEYSLPTNNHFTASLHFKVSIRDKLLNLLFIHAQHDINSRMHYQFQLPADPHLWRKAGLSQQVDILDKAVDRFRLDPERKSIEICELFTIENCSECIDNMAEFIKSCGK